VAKHAYCPFYRCLYFCHVFFLSPPVSALEPRFTGKTLATDISQTIIGQGKVKYKRQELHLNTGCILIEAPRLEYNQQE